MKNAVRITALSLLVVATLAGCFKGKVDLTINSDDTIDGSMTIAIQEGLGESLGMTDDDILGQMTGDLSGEFDGATEAPYSEDGYIGKVYSFTGQPLDAFEGDDDGSDIAITREGDLFIVDGTWSTEDTDTEGMDPASMGAEFTFAVTFPGSVTESNGTVSDDGKTVTWDLLDPPATLHAEGKATESGMNWLWIILGVIALAVVAAAITTVLILRKRDARSTDVEPPLPTGAPVEFGDPAAIPAPAPELGAAPAAPAAPQEFVPEPAPDAAPEDPAAR